MQKLLFNRIFTLFCPINTASYLFPGGQVLYEISEEGLYDVLELNGNERFLWVDEQYILTLENTTIYTRQFDDPEQKHVLCEMQIDGFNVGYQGYHVDVAGEWLFFYEILDERIFETLYSKTGQQLLYKINIITGETVKNDVEWDASQLEPYSTEA